MRNSNQHRGLAASVLFAAMAQVLWPAPAAAQTLPTGLVSAIDQNGAITPSVSTVGNTMTVTLNSPRSIYNWTSFDVGSGYTVNVVGAASSDLMVNRVIGANYSSINGTVQSNANVWLLNPNGIVVGSTGQFDVGGLLLSTLDVTDADVFGADTSFQFSGVGTTAISIASGAQLAANTGDVTLLADAIVANGTFVSSGANTLLGMDGATILFDANLSAIVSYDIDAGSTTNNAINVGAGANFTGTRNVLVAAGFSPGFGNVLLSNPGGANDIKFNAGSVTLVSRDANVIAQGLFTTPGDLTIDAALMFQGNGAPTVGGDYSITAQDFSGGVFSPTFVGTSNDFSITDTQGGLTVGGLSAPGNFSITAQGASLNTAGSLSSTNGDVSLGASDSISLGGDVTTFGAHSVFLNAGGTITQTAGGIVTDMLSAAAGSSIVLTNLNAWAAAGFTTSSGNISAVSTTSWLLQDTTSGGALAVGAMGGGGLSVAGNVQAAGNMTLDGSVVVGGVTSLSSTGGSVTITGDVDGANALTVSSASGAYFNGNVGAATALASLTVNGDSTFDGTTLRTVGAIDLDDVTASNASTFNITAGGTLAATSLTDANAPMAVSANGIQLGSGDAPSFAFSGTGNLDVTGVLTTPYLSGAIGGSATLGGDNHIQAIGPFSSNGLTLRTLDSLAISDVVDAGTGDARIEAVNQSLQIMVGGAVNGGDIALSSSSFDNYQGANALAAGGHWVIYQQAPSGNTYGGLDSANTALWGATIATLAPSSVTGNRYVFASSPTLTFTSIDSTKTYGTDLSAAPGSLFAVSGYEAGVAGAYLADDATTAYSGAPLLTSAGFAERASVAGGPYAIGIANGTLASAAGYQFAFNGVGSLTVDPKALSGTPATTTRVYDGTTDASGTIGLAGVVTGDTVGATGTFAFVDPNAGLGKTVNLSGVALNGADAGNYTLTLPATVLGDILQKALTGTATVATKTYNGTNAGIGTVGLTGVVLGDDVAGSATFAFSDGNAGTGKTVTVSGGTLSGADAGNYTLTLPATVLGDILQKALTGTATVATKTYNGTNAGIGTVGLTGVVLGDDVAGSATFAFSDGNAGTGKTVTVSGGTLSGADAGNYTLTLPATVLGDILQKALTGTATATTKTYDGTNVGTGTIGLTGVVLGDDVAGSATFAFSDGNAGTGKTVTVSGATLSGADAGNYTVTLPASVLGDILQKALTGTATANTKTYDGTTAGTGTVGVTGAVAGDDVAGSATFAFSDGNAGTGKTVTVSGGVLSGADAGNYTLTLPASVLGDILQKALTGTATANTKTYDGTNAGTGTVGLAGVVLGDDVAGSATFAFSDGNAGTGKTVTVSGAMLSGADAGNYTVTLPASVLGDILQKALTGTATATTKTYDGTTVGTGTVGLTGAVAGDDVAGSATFAFSDGNAGLGKTVTVSGGALSGADAGNYTLTLPASVLGDILQKALTGTATANTKTYDGTNAGTGTVGLTGAVAGDDVAGSATFAFSDGNAGTGKTVTVSGGALSGADAGNYTLTLPATVLGDILQKALTGTATATTKTYDGTNVGTGTVGLAGVVLGDDVAGSATFAFSDGNAGTGKTVTVSGGALSGADAGNYTLTLPASVLGDILQKALTGTATANTKTYDGTTVGTGTVGLAGVVPGDDVAGSATFAFSDGNAGLGKTVTVSGGALGGADAGNYTVTLPATVLGDILRRAITVAADPASKAEGASDPAFAYGITEGSLVAGDALSGSLARDAGEAPGAYAIGQGTLAASDNYQLTFVGSTLIITPVDTGPVNPAAGLVLPDPAAGVVRFLLGLQAAREGRFVPLQIVDERAACDPGAPSGACGPGRQ